MYELAGESRTTGEDGRVADVAIGESREGEAKVKIR